MVLLGYDVFCLGVTDPDFKCEFLIILSCTPVSFSNKHKYKKKMHLPQKPEHVRF